MHDSRKRIYLFFHPVSVTDRFTDVEARGVGRLSSVSGTCRKLPTHAAATTLPLSAAT
jgi:hypothetical protein